MILSVIAYGAPILRKVAEDITADYNGLKELIADMWETMYASSGVGLAAPQINRNIRIFTVDSAQMFESMDDEDKKKKYADAPGVKKIFINARLLKTEGKEWAYSEGCLSIPKIHEDVMRPESVTLQYMDEDFVLHTDTFHGLTARIIQHEYDHIEGKLFIDYLKPLKKKLLQRKLSDITKGKVNVDYKMSFVK